MSWTPEAEQRLRALVADPTKPTASQIATELANGFTRNAVISKINRLGLTLPNHGLNNVPGAAKPRKHPNRDNLRAARILAKCQAAQEKHAQAALAAIPAPASRNVPLLELDRGQCRFPTNDAAPGEIHLFCGAKAVRGEPYCAFHCRRSLAPPRAA